MKVDVIVCTYKSEKYLEQCLTSIEQFIPLNELIVVDHYSPDRTVEIAKKHNAAVYYEKYSLGNARQVGINHSETPIFIFVDSDVVFYDGKWFPRAVSMVGENTRVGGLGLWTPTTLPPPGEESTLTSGGITGSGRMSQPLTEGASSTPISFIGKRLKVSRYRSISAHLTTYT
nr:glycosyltransferase family A protein [Candidatus Njordarchaeum guaymaensis]